MPSLSSFVNSSQYTKENLTFPFVAGMILGTGYSGPNFNGASKATINDPGGLFGWLLYGRSLYSTPKGATTNTYLVYNNPYDLAGDLNNLSGVTNCLVSATGVGGTYALFVNIGGGYLSPQTAGNQFLQAINYLAYGGSLVVSGSVAGFNDYLSDTNNSFDVVIDNVMSSTPQVNVSQWLIDKPYTIGIYPTLPSSSTGISGSGYTMTAFGTLFGDVSLTSGTTVANRIFNVCGTKTVTDLDTSSLQSNTKITYTLNAAGDVAGFFARAKNLNESYLTVAGLDRSTVINGNITNPIDWSSSLKTSLRTNRVNFFVVNDPKFLGSDLVGATYPGPAVTVNDRVGPAKMRADLLKAINNVGLRYVFDINNQTTREQVVSQVQTAIEPFAPFLDTTKTQIICNGTNNTDNDTTLKIDLIVKPILGTDSLSISTTYTQ
jgi:hypothetical protein